MIFSQTPRGRRGATRVNALTADFMRDGGTYTACGTWGYLAVAGGTAIAGYLSKPKAPKAATVKPVDLQEEQRTAIGGNLAASDDIEALLSRANAFTADQAIGLTEKAMPGYSAIAGKFMKQADNLLTNPFDLSDDVASNLTRLAAERGISTGVRGEAGDFSLLRDFGINSLQQGNQRISQAQSILQTIGGLAPRVNPMSPMSLYVTPAQQANVAGANNGAMTSAEQAKLNADAAADNATASMWGGIVGNLSGMLGSKLAVDGAAKKKTSTKDSIAADINF